jgi:dTDP-4-dehydrorhamnose reductase
MTTRTALVTGATGLLGCSLVPALRAAGWQVVTHGHSSAAPVQADVRADLRADLRDSQATQALVQRVQPALLVNLAALTNVDTCETDPHAAYLLNVRVVENLAAACGSAHLLHISTDQLYDGTGPHAEDDVRVTNTYAFSKRASELAAAAAAQATVLRTNFFGRSALPGRHSFSDWLFNALSQGQAIQVFDDVCFSPLAMDTLSSLIVRVAEQRPLGVFNAGTRGGMSKADFAFAFAAAAGLPTASMRRADSSAVNLKAYRPKDMRMDSSRIEQALAMNLPELASEIQRTGASYRAPA